MPGSRPSRGRESSTSRSRSGRGRPRPWPRGFSRSTARCRAGTRRPRVPGSRRRFPAASRGGRAPARRCAPAADRPATRAGWRPRRPFPGRTPTPSGLRRPAAGGRPLRPAPRGDRASEDGRPRGSADRCRSGGAGPAGPVDAGATRAAPAPARAPTRPSSPGSKTAALRRPIGRRSFAPGRPASTGSPRVWRLRSTASAPRPRRCRCRSNTGPTTAPPCRGPPRRQAAP